jgi:hypothetical protein
MPRLLIVHHTPSPGMQAMFEAVVSGTGAPGREDLEACWELGATLAAELAAG